MLSATVLFSLAVCLAASIGYLIGYRKGTNDTRSRLVKDNVIDFFTRRKVR